jgi:D-lactate dehydrogenase (cytochrome)/glycolate oxidase
LITEAVLRLAPLLQSFVGVLGQFNDIEDLVSTVIDIRKARLWTMINEFLDERTSQLVGLNNKFHLWLGVDVNAGCEGKVLEQLKNNVAKNRGEVVGVAYSLGEFNKLLEPRRRLYTAALQATFGDYGNNALVFIEDIAVPEQVAERRQGLDGAGRQIRRKDGDWRAYRGRQHTPDHVGQ